MNTELEGVSRILRLRGPCGKKELIKESRGGGEKLGCYTESGEEDEGCSAGGRQGGKQQDGLRRGFGVCVCLSVCVQPRERKKSLFSDKVRVHAKIDKLAAFLRSLCSYFVKIFAAEKLSLKSPVSQTLWAVLCLLPLSYC